MRNTKVPQRNDSGYDTDTNYEKIEKNELNSKGNDVLQNDNLECDIIINEDEFKGIMHEDIHGAAHLHDNEAGIESGRNDNVEFNNIEPLVCKYNELEVDKTYASFIHQWKRETSKKLQCVRQRSKKELITEVQTLYRTIIPEVIDLTYEVLFSETEPYADAMKRLKHDTVEAFEKSISSCQEKALHGSPALPSGPPGSEADGVVDGVASQADGTSQVSALAARKTSVTHKLILDGVATQATGSHDRDPKTQTPPPLNGTSIWICNLLLMTLRRILLVMGSTDLVGHYMGPPNYWR